jgi:hypothetical protein
MEMIARHFTKLEKEVLDLFLTGAHPGLQVLRTQFSRSQVSRRELTGVGFYTYFDVPPDVPRLDNRGSLWLSGVAADIDGLRNGAGFVLHVENGTLQFLEGFTYDDPWPEPEKVGAFKLSLSPVKDEELRKL